MSLINGGPAPNFFSPLLFNLFVGKEVIPSIQHIHDDEIKDELMLLKNCTTVEEVNTILNNKNTYLTAAGCPIYISDMEKKEQAYRGVLNFYVCTRIQNCLAQIIEGFKTLNFYETIRANVDIFQEVFCFTPTPLTAIMLINLFQPNMSVDGSNFRIKEAKALGYFRDFLQDCEDNMTNKCTLEDVMVFVSGLNRLPPLNQCEMFTLEFLNDSSVFPTANTCSFLLRIPTMYASYEEFKKKMEYGIIEGLVFGVE